MLYTIVGMLVIILDQAVKFWVDKTINYTNPQIDLIPGVISLVRVQNDGAAFSFLAGGGARIWFIVLTLAFTVLVIIALATNFISGKFGRWCMVLVTAGGLANMIDRVLYGLVIDMFKIDLFDFAVFNVADIFITVFSIAFIIYILFGGEKEPELNEDEFDVADEESADRPKREKKAKKKKKDEYYYEDEEELSAPKKKSSRKSKALLEEDEEEELPRKKAAKKEKQRTLFDEIEEEDAPVKKVKQRSVDDYLKQDRKAAESREAQRAQRAAAAAAATQTTVDPSDPFAEWERANAKVRNERSSSSVARAMTDTETGARPVATKKTQRTAAPAAQAAAAPVKTAPATKPQKAEAPVSSDSLDLDDILNEFK